MTTSIKLKAARSFLKSLQAVAADLDEGFTFSILAKTLEADTGTVTIKLKPTAPVKAKATKATKAPKAKSTKATKAKAVASTSSGDALQDRFEKAVDKFGLEAKGLKKSFFGKELTDTNGNKFVIGYLSRNGKRISMSPVEGGRGTVIPLDALLTAIKTKKKPVIKGDAPKTKATKTPKTPKANTNVDTKSTSVLSSTDMKPGQALSASQKTQLKAQFKKALPKVKGSGITLKHFGTSVKVSKGTGIIVGINTKQSKVRVYVKALGKFIVKSL